MDTQHTFEVVLTVKGQTRESAKGFVSKKLAEWLVADADDNIPGYGYPDGSLLIYHVANPVSLDEGVRSHDV